VLVVAALIACGVAATARAEPRVALVRLEPLGLDAARAAGLEALFRAELERMLGAPLAPRPADDLVRACSGEAACLTAIGRRLGVERVVWGNVGELGDSYVVNLKLVDVERGVEERRVAETLRGSADELIEAVRVAAYRLLAPEKVRGAIAVESDARGARVSVDGRRVGTTPLAGPIEGLEVGAHVVRLDADGMAPFSAEVTVRFQKTSVLAATLAAVDPRAAGPVAPRRRGALASPWTWAAVGAAAIVVGVVVGRALASDGVIDCAREPERCP
jgi:hypothetical protein